MTILNRAAILSLFSGAALAKATVALDGVEASLAQGFWLPNVSRGARAALSKPNEAQKAYKKIVKKLYGKAARRLDYKHPAESLDSPVTYGFHHARGLIGFESKPGNEEFRELAVRVREAFLPLDEVFKMLDATRPAPVFTYMNASPTVTATLEAMDAVKAEVCPHEYVKVPNEDGKGWHFEVELKWPEGTKHGTSKYRMANCQCESCGHAIRNAYNWMPMLVTGKDGSHRSVWAGRDCAETFLGCKLTGDMQIRNK